MSVEGLGKSPVGLQGVDLSFLHNGASAKPPKAPDPAGDKDTDLVPDPKEPAPAPVPENDAKKAPERPQNQGHQGDPQAEEPEGDEDSPSARAIVAYMPVRVRNQLKKTASASNRTYVDVLFDAVDELDARLPEVFAEHLAATAPTSLFAHRSRRATVKAATSGKGSTPVQVPFRLHPEDLAVLDDRARAYASGNRSEFIRIVLDAYLNA